MSSPSLRLTNVTILSASDWNSVSSSNTPNGVGLAVFANVVTGLSRNSHSISMKSRDLGLDEKTNKKKGAPLGGAFLF